MSVIFLLSTLQLPEYVVDLTIKSDEKDSDEKLNLEVRVSCLYFSALFWSSFSPAKLSSLFFFFHSLQLPECVVDLSINSECMGKIVILILDKSRKDDILKFLWIAN